MKRYADCGLPPEELEEMASQDAYLLAAARRLTDEINFPYLYRSEGENNGAVIQTYRGPQP